MHMFRHALGTLSAPPATHSDTYKIRLTFGFLDPQTRFFQKGIAHELMEEMTEFVRVYDIKGVRFHLPVVQPFHASERYFRVYPSMWDVCIDYVLCPEQAIFVSDHAFVVVVAPENMTKMEQSLMRILEGHRETWPATDMTPLQLFVL